MPLQSMESIRGLARPSSAASDSSDESDHDCYDSSPEDKGVSSAHSPSPLLGAYSPSSPRSQSFGGSSQDFTQNGPELSVDKNVFYNQETRKYMKIIDTYKKLGIGKHIELPRLVIAGAQSSGKSSLLENLTRLPVPITSGIGTRFPIEITLIEDSTKRQIKASIVRDPKLKDLSKSDLEKIEKFNRSKVFTKDLTPAEFEAILREASLLLGVRAPVFAHDPATSKRSNTGKEISSHTLQIEMRGPDYKSLSLVDTPGLYQTHTKDQTSGPVQQIEDLVLSLIAEKRTVIVTVMEAGQQIATQKILGFAGDADVSGNRTLGVLTKCDLVKSGETDDLEAAYKRARNEERTLKHGWYVVKNRSSTDAKKKTSLEDARREEAKLFSGDDWHPSISGIEQTRMGIAALREGLSNVFCAHIRSEFPEFNEQTRKILKEKRKQLQSLGPSRSTADEQRVYLRNVVANYQLPKSRCLEDDLRAQNGTEDLTLLHRMLSTIKREKLRDALRENGACWTFEAATEKEDLESDAAADRLLADNHSSDRRIYTWINDRYQHAKISLLPGFVPPALVVSLYKEQTQNWETVTAGFVSAVEELFIGATEQCLDIACQNTLVVASLKSLLRQKVEAEIASFEDKCLRYMENDREALEVIAGEEQFQIEVKKARFLRLKSAGARLNLVSSVGVKDTGFGGGFAPKTPTKTPFAGFGMPREDYPSPPPSSQASTINGGSLFENIRIMESKETALEVMTHDRLLVYQIHDTLKAYYNMSVQRYTDAVCTNALERSFVYRVMNLFSDEFINALSDVEVQKIAAESVDARKVRRELNEDIEKLEKAIAESEAIMREPIAA